MNGKFIKFELVSYKESLKFGSNQGNRIISSSHLLKLKKQCLESLEILPPITINLVTGNIIDGQHRLKAYQCLIEAGAIEPERKIKVMFLEIPKEEEKKAIINANINSKNWSLNDYVLSYMKEGNDSYIKLEEWCKSHSLVSDRGVIQYRYGAAILLGKGHRKNLKNGQFKLTEETLRIGDKVYKEIEEIVSILELGDLQNSWVESLAVSWNNVRKLSRFSEWRNALKENKDELVKLPKNKMKDWDIIFTKAYSFIESID